MKCALLMHALSTMGSASWVGAHMPGLLPPPCCASTAPHCEAMVWLERPAANGTLPAAHWRAGGSGGQGLLETLVQAVAGCVDGAASRIKGLGGWLAQRFQVRLGTCVGGVGSERSRFGAAPSPLVGMERARTHAQAQQEWMLAGLTTVVAAHHQPGPTVRTAFLTSCLASFFPPSYINEQGIGNALASKLGFFEDEEAAEAEGGQKQQADGRGAQRVIISAVVCSVAVLCMLLSKRPVVRPAF